MGQAQQKRRAVLVVEDDAELRYLTAALFEDEKVDTIECESAEAALAVMLIGGREIAMVFADVRLRGVMDGIDLKWLLPQTAVEDDGAFLYYPIRASLAPKFRALIDVANKTPE